MSLQFIFCLLGSSLGYRPIGMGQRTMPIAPHLSANVGHTTQLFGR